MKRNNDADRVRHKSTLTKNVAKRRENRARELNVTTPAENSFKKKKKKKQLLSLKTVFYHIIVLLISFFFLIIEKEEEEVTWKVVHIH